ncbi:MAG: hypothetical protein JW776_03230 [Candidatus Lokiarchaeota archaeon]|nr:hypothetical protein [Candidatus Lokiarchaeota archaeon]
MWEWRTFLSIEKSRELDLVIESILNTEIIESRIDLYYNFHSIDFGLKIRSIMSEVPLLELKILEESNGIYELWDKCVKYPISRNAECRSVENFINLLKNQQGQSPKVHKVIDLLQERNYSLNQLIKKRKKKDLGNITLEKTIINYETRTWVSVQIESLECGELDRFLENSLLIKKNHFKNISYPRFLLEF